MADFSPSRITSQHLMRGTNCNGDRALRWVEPIRAALLEFGILELEPCAMLIAQCAHESMRFRRVVEDLDYTAQRILQVWPKRFTAETAWKYQHRPEELANLVYGGRLGNGQALTGDGWRYRGRGLIQITGRANYRAAGKAIGVDLELEPALASTTNVAARVACWYFTSRGCVEPASRGDVVMVTRLVNGGTVGLDDRAALYAACLRALSGG